MYRKLKSRVHEIMNASSEGGIAGKVCEIFLITLVIVNVIIVIADTFDLPPEIKNPMHRFENISVIIFTVEYILRVWTSDAEYPKLGKFRARIRYIFTIEALIDLIAILPFYLPFWSANLFVLHTFRVFRVLRLLKVNRYTHAFNEITHVLRQKAHQLISSMWLVSVMLIIASVLMYNAENEAQPEVFNNALSGLWWAVSTFTMSGTNIYPITESGKVISVIIAFLGIGFIALPTGIITAGFAEKTEEKTAEALLKYKELLDKGAITEEEFDRKKKQLLNL